MNIAIYTSIFVIMNYEAFFEILYTYAKFSGRIKDRGLKLMLHNAVFGSLDYGNPDNWIFGKGLKEEGYLSAMGSGTKDTPKEILAFLSGDKAGIYCDVRYPVPSPETFQKLLDIYISPKMLGLLIRQLKGVIRNDSRIDMEACMELDSVLENEGAAAFVYECFMIAVNSPNRQNVKPRKPKGECMRTQERAKKRAQSMSDSERSAYALEILLYREGGSKIFDEDNN